MSDEVISLDAFRFKSRDEIEKAGRMFSNMITENKKLLDDMMVLPEGQYQSSGSFGTRTISFTLEVFEHK